MATVSNQKIFVVKRPLKQESEWNKKYLRMSHASKSTGCGREETINGIQEIQEVT